MKIFEKIKICPLLFYIIVGAISVTIIGLIIILPMVLVIKFSAWFFLLYLPIIGAGIGIDMYIDK